MSNLFRKILSAKFHEKTLTSARGCGTMPVQRKPPPGGKAGGNCHGKGSARKEKAHLRFAGAGIHRRRGDRAGAGLHRHVPEKRNQAPAHSSENVPPLLAGAAYLHLLLLYQDQPGAGPADCDGQHHQPRHLSAGGYRSLSPYQHRRDGGASPSQYSHAYAVHQVPQSGGAPGGGGPARRHGAQTATALHHLP